MHKPHERLEEAVEIVRQVRDTTAGTEVFAFLNEASNLIHDSIVSLKDREDYLMRQAYGPKNPEITARLESIRRSIEAEAVSYGEVIELQSYAEHIDPSDVVLREWAGLPEFPDDETE